MSAQSGLMPDDVLNLNLGQVQAAVNGYNDRMLDDTVTAIIGGYYAAYFLTAKHATLDGVLKRLMSKAKKHTHKSSNKTASDLDAEIAKFAQRDAKRFLNGEVNKHG